MLDDDTLIVKPTLQLLLNHLDPSVPHYVGNAVGDFRKRFAHGGSAYLLSRAAMRTLYVDNPAVVHASYRESLTETWGDRLIASALIKVGVYLDERHSHYFNGESPLATRIRADRFCSPLLGFHKLNTAEMMRDAGRTLGKIRGIITWKDVWEMYAGASWTDTLRPSWTDGRDHVGEQATGLEKTYRTRTADQCAERCRKNGESCLAWTWEDTQVCYTIPWFVVGGQSRGKWSGLNIYAIRRLIGQCEQAGSWKV